jgi:hypothetical protein
MIKTTRLGHTNDKLQKTSIHELSLFPHEVYTIRKSRELQIKTVANMPIHIYAVGNISVINSGKTI